MMHNQQRARIARLLVWFCLNLIIFVACYLNYRLQLKHRYLYKTLNVGLCFSRAAAMVINFNLLLVWIPMCKYSLTRIACLATSALRNQRRLHQQLLKLNAEIPTISSTLQGNLTIQNLYKSDNNLSSEQPRRNTHKSSRNISRFMDKIMSSTRAAIRQLQQWFLVVKINFINSFLIAVDNCVSLHTICATTITVASLIHTAAHIMNVINFSKNFDPLLSNLNMAEYKGQNPLNLLLSVPGVTGSLMTIILILMSLSSIDIIRNSSYDLFQIFHRLSIIFVILLFLHPSSHVLKEQSNVERHNPELCYDQISITRTTTTTGPFRNDSLEMGRGGALLSNADRLDNMLGAPFREKPPLPPQELKNNSATNTLLFLIRTSSRDNHNQANSYNGRSNSTTNNGGFSRVIQNNDTTNSNEKVSTTDLIKVTNTSIRTSGINHRIDLATTNKSDHRRYILDENYSSANNSKKLMTLTTSTTTTTRVAHPTGMTGGSDCLDSQPLFVAQSSVCWYVLTFGLSCYLLDLLFRRSRRSRSKIQLLDARSDGEGNLIELILSNNHKRFAQWLPGQFVYVNCPQVATYEWHPFTISSMDNRNRQFTLHIKTGGDWTKKLRKKLETNRIKLMSVWPMQTLEAQRSQNQLTDNQNLRTNIFKCAKSNLDLPALPEFECYNNNCIRQQQQIQCTMLAQLHTEFNQCYERDKTYQTSERNGSIRIELDNRIAQLESARRSKPCLNLNSNNFMKGNLDLELYIDGPFHSPFERLLEQQVSICIASGVGWTAFSSVLQCLTSNMNSSWINNYTKDKWWNQWNSFACADRHRVSTSKVVYDSCKNTTQNNPSYIMSNIHNNNIESHTEGEQVEDSKLSSNLKKISNTKLHLMVIVTSIEQLKPFYRLAVNYFDHIQSECKTKSMEKSNPVGEISAFITRSTIEDQTVRNFVAQENLFTLDKEEAIQVNSAFMIKFGKPKFDMYLSSIGSLYNGKISVYCCGSYQVKKNIREICQNLNRNTKCGGKVFYSYHEESF